MKRNAKGWKVNVIYIHKVTGKKLESLYNGDILPTRKQARGLLFLLSQGQTNWKTIGKVVKVNE